MAKAQATLAADIAASRPAGTITADEPAVTNAQNLSMAQATVNAGIGEKVAERADHDGAGGWR